MRILQVIHYFSPLHGGGSINVAYNLSKYLAEMGHEVTIFTTDFELDKEYIQSLDGLRVVPFHCIANIGGMLITPKMKGQLKKEIKDFDVIHMHNFRSYQNVVAHHYAKKNNVPYILQAHGSVLPFFQKQGLKRIFDIFGGYKILRDASKIIAVTRIEAEQYKKMGLGEDKIEIVPNGIDMSECVNLPEKGEFRREYSIKDDEKVILYLGRLHKSKGINLLVEVFSDLIKELDDVRLVLVGPDDGYQSALKELIQALKVHDKVLFTGFVSNDEKMAAFVDADVFVNPRVDEIFGLVFLEANACGTPVICSKGCGIANVIDGKTGLAVHNDKDQLRDAIFKILSNEGLRRKFGEEGRSLVRGKFGWDKVVRKVEGIYKDIVLN